MPEHEPDIEQVELERFSVDHVSSLHPNPNGALVRYSDYEELEAASKIDHDVAYHATMRRKEVEAERDQADKHVENVKIAWHRSDEEKNAAHVKVMAAATEKRRQLEAQLDRAIGGIDEAERTALDRIEVFEAERDQAQSKADDQHRMVGEIHTQLEQARKAADEADRTAANWKRRAESADRGRDEAARRERQRVRDQRVRDQRVREILLPRETTQVVARVDIEEALDTLEDDDA